MIAKENLVGQIYLLSVYARPQVRRSGFDVDLPPRCLLTRNLQLCDESSRAASLSSLDCPWNLASSRLRIQLLLSYQGGSFTLSFVQTILNTKATLTFNAGPPNLDSLLAVNHYNSCGSIALSNFNPILVHLNLLSSKFWPFVLFTFFPFHVAREKELQQNNQFIRIPS